MAANICLKSAEAAKNAATTIPFGFQFVWSSLHRHKQATSKWRTFGLYIIVIR